MDTSRLDGTLFGAERVRRLSAVVAGAGALGNEVVKALGLLGVSRVLIVDPDTVEPSNLSRSFLFRQRDYDGFNKAEALAAAAGGLFPDTEMLATPGEIADTGPAIEGADLIFSCVDNDSARVEIAYLSTRSGVPVADAGLGGQRYSHGRVSWFPGKEAACYACLLPAQRRREILTVWQSDSFSCWAAVEGGVVPSTPTMSAIIGSMQVELGIRNLLGAASHSETVELSLDGAPRLQLLRNVRAVSCPFHGSVDEIRVLVAGDLTADQVLASVRVPVGRVAWVHLDWPVCARARCLLCGHCWAPLVRAGLLRRNGRCPACASGNLLIERNISSITSGDAFARRPLREFGIHSPCHISVRVR